MSHQVNLRACRNISSPDGLQMSKKSYLCDCSAVGVTIDPGIVEAHDQRDTERKYR